MKGYICVSIIQWFGSISVYRSLQGFAGFVCGVRVYVRKRGRGAESISFDDEVFDDFGEVGYHVRAVTIWGCSVL